MLTTGYRHIDTIRVMSNVDFINWLKNQMEIRGLKPAELADILNVSRSHVGRILNQERQPGNEFLRALADAFNQPDEEIFWIAGELRSRLTTRKNPQAIEFESLLRDIPEDERDQLMMIIRAFHKKFAR